jgi:hypothetical protein
MNLKDISEEFVIATYDTPSPDSWRTHYELIYNFPQESKRWRELEKLDKQVYGTRIKKIEALSERFKKEKGKDPNKNSNDFKDFKEKEEQKELEDLAKKFEKKNPKKKAFLSDGKPSIAFSQWKLQKEMSEQKHFWDFFSSKKKWGKLHKDIKSILTDIKDNAGAGKGKEKEMDLITLKIKTIIVDNDKLMRQNYEIVTGKSPTDKDGNHTDEYLEWKKKNSKKKDFLEEMRSGREGGIPPKPNLPTEEDIWDSLTEDQERHNEIVKEFRSLAGHTQDSRFFQGVFHKSFYLETYLGRGKISVSKKINEGKDFYKSKKEESLKKATEEALQKGEIKKGDVNDFKENWQPKEATLKDWQNEWQIYLEEYLRNNETIKEPYRDAEIYDLVERLEKDRLNMGNIDYWNLSEIIGYEESDNKGFLTSQYIEDLLNEVEGETPTQDFIDFILEENQKLAENVTFEINTDDDIDFFLYFLLWKRMKDQFYEIRNYAEDNLHRLYYKETGKKATDKWEYPEEEYLSWLKKRREKGKKNLLIGLPKIVLDTLEMENQLYIPDGRLLRIRWSKSSPLFTKSEQIINPKYLNSYWSGNIKTQKQKKSWEKRKYIPIYKAFRSARQILVKQLKYYFTPISQSVFLVRADQCFMPNYETKDGKLVWREDIEEADITWDKDVKGGFILSGTAQRPPDHPEADTFQEIYISQFMPLYTLINEYMRSKSEDKLQEEYENLPENKKNNIKALDGFKPTQDYLDWRESLDWEKKKGTYFKPRFQYGYNDLIGKGFDDWVSFLRVKPSTERSFVQTMMSIGTSLWNTDPKYMDDLLNKVETKYIDYVEDDAPQKRGRLKNSLDLLKEKYIRLIKNYPFAQKMTYESLKQYADNYDAFVKAYNKTVPKKKQKKPITTSQIDKRVETAEAYLNNKFQWFFTIPNSHFRPERRFQEPNVIENRRKKLESYLNLMYEKFNRETDMPSKVKKRKILKKDLVKWLQEGKQDEVIEIYTKLMLNAYRFKFKDPDKYIGWIEGLVPDSELPTKEEIKERNKAIGEEEDRDIKDKLEALKSAEELTPITTLKSKISRDNIEKKEKKEERDKEPKKETEKPEKEDKFSFSPPKRSKEDKEPKKEEPKKEDKEPKKEHKFSFSPPKGV